MQEKKIHTAPFYCYFIVIYNQVPHGIHTATGRWLGEIIQNQSKEKLRRLSGLQTNWMRGRRHLIKHPSVLLVWKCSVVHAKRRPVTSHPVWGAADDRKCLRWISGASASIVPVVAGLAALHPAELTLVESRGAQTVFPLEGPRLKCNGGPRAKIKHLLYCTPL